jgi:16S rRNA (guanine1516-N2)-methyltransferase
MKKSLSISVSSTTDSATFLHKAKSLADKINLPYHQSFIEATSDFLLLYTENGLHLAKIINTSQMRSLLYVDFVKGRSGYRHSKNLTTRQPLAKAVGIKPGFRPSVYDATAGLGRDAFVLACLGCAVSMCERSPVLYSLLEDGLDRASQDKKTAKIVSTRMTLFLGDSKINLLTSSRKFHTVYLDPMYPHHTSSALNKQEMRVIRDLVGDDTDDDKLLELAFATAQNRVVVKRPKRAEKLSDRTPSFVIPMKNSRYDVYLAPHEGV